MLKDQKVKNMVILAMLTAISYVIVALIRIPVVAFLSYEPKDVVITIGGFLLGPTASFVISLLVSLLEMVTISETGPIGALMNLLSTCTFACTAAIIYKKKHTLGGAILALIGGTILMTIAMLLWNWHITPIYMGYPRDVVASNSGLFQFPIYPRGRWVYRVQTNTRIMQQDHSHGKQQIDALLY